MYQKALAYPVWIGFDGWGAMYQKVLAYPVWIGSHADCEKLIG